MFVSTCGLFAIICLTFFSSWLLFIKSHRGLLIPCLETLLPTPRPDLHLLIMDQVKQPHSLMLSDKTHLFQTSVYSSHLPLFDRSITEHS